MSAAGRPGPVARLLLLLLGGYRRWISPLLGPRCRFAPSCSAYAVQAVSTHGALRGSGLAVGRLLRCHPFHPGGFDPVPPPRRSSATMEGLVPLSVSTGPAPAVAQREDRPCPARPRS